jgi:polysaccharide biosynthesis/export protein
MNPKRRCCNGRWLALFLLCAGGFVGLAAQQPAPVSRPEQSNQKGQAGQPSFQERYPRYKLQPGDSFDLSFEYSPEFNQTLTIQPDGFINLREVGDVYVSGLTFAEIATVLSQKYGEILNEPKVAVTPKDIDKRYFIATGEVARPGRYELRGDMTITKAIAMAGGLAPDRAKHSEVVLFRQTGDSFSAGRVVNLKKMLSERDLSEDLHLKPGDLIFIPQNKWSKMKSLVPVPGVGLTMMPPMP